MIDFPASPTLGKSFSAAGVTWIWDGAKWLPSGLTPTVAPGINSNRIINGDMRIDQRNNGVGGTASGYTVDRWMYIASQPNLGNWGRGPAAIGFGAYLGFTSTSAHVSIAADYFELAQPVEADMVSDFQWGTPNAQPVTLSFWCSSTLTGTFSGSIQNYAGTRTYPFSFSIPAAIVWTKIVIAIPGDIAGTWVMSGNAGSMYVAFDLGSGSSRRGPAGAWASANYIGVTGSVSVVATNGAGLTVTGVKLEIGSVATPFNRQSLAKSMADCQRYYSILSSLIFGGYTVPAQILYMSTSLPVTMRAAPTITFSGISYGAASGLVVASGPAPSTLGVSITANSTGTCWGTFNAIMSAEL